MADIAALPQDGPVFNGEPSQHPGGDHPAEQNGNQPDLQESLANGSEPGPSTGAPPPPEEPATKSGPSSPVKAKVAVSDGSKIKPINTTAKPGIKPGPPTPLVKKILNSGTFGSGASKPPATKSAVSPPAAVAVTASPESVAEPAKAPAAPVSPTKPTAVPPPNRRSTLAPPTSIPKDASTSSASRRTSLAPSTSAPSISKTNGTSAIAKPSASKVPAPVGKSSTTTPPAKAITPVPRKSVASPTPSTSSAKAPLAKSRLSVGGSAPTPASRPAPTKPSTSSTTTTAAAAAAAKPAKSTTSKTTSSTLSEVKEGHKVDAELEQKYRDAVADVSAKTEQIAALEVELASLKSALDDKLADIGQRTSEMEDLQKATASGTEAREALEVEVRRLQGLADALREEQEQKIASSEADLHQLHADLEASNSKVAALEEARADLESSLTLAREQLEAAQTAQGEDAAAVAIEHEALLKAKADLEEIRVETNNLASSHAQEKAEYEQTIASLKAHVTIVEGSVETANSELNALKREREDTSNKLAELEVEVLELKDAAEVADDSKVKEIANLKSSFAAEKEQLRRDLEANLAQAIEANQAAERQWEEATRATGEKHSAELLQAIKNAEEVAHVANLESQKALAADHAEAVWAKEVESLQKIEEAKNASAAKVQELEEEVKRLTAELEGQEAKYSAKVDAVKLEHAELLKQAFADAKSEAGAEHQKELFALREEFQVTLKQVNEGHKTQITALETASKEDKDELSKSLGKNISSLTVELSATRDDLAKAKASITSSTAEIQSLKEQLLAAQKAAEMAVTDATGAQTEYIESLNKQIANSQRELADIQEMLKASQVSFTDELSQIQQNHTTELEEASKGRVAALEDLQMKNDERLAKVKGELAELQANIEDERNAKQQAEAQLATLQSQIPPAAPKASGATMSKDEHKAELQALHHAHDLKMDEKEAEHRNALKAERDRVAELLKEKEELEGVVSRKEMEKSMFETEAEDLVEENKKLAADIEELKKLIEPEPKA